MRARHPELPRREIESPSRVWASFRHSGTVRKISSDRLVQGRSGVTRLPEDFNPRLMSRVVAPASFDGVAHFGAARLRMLDRVSQFALVAAAEAIADAGALFERDDRATTGVFVGTGMGGAHSTDEGYQTVYEERSDRVKPYAVLMAMNNAAAAWIGIDHHLLGPNLTLFDVPVLPRRWRSAEAWKRIATGELDVMIAGGSEAPLTFGTLKAWEALRTLAVEDPDDVSASCKPFAKNRSGLVLGEGAAMVVLESWERADEPRCAHSRRACGLWSQHGCGAHHPADRDGPGVCDDTRAGECAHLSRRRGLTSTRTVPQRWRTTPWRLPRSNRFLVLGAYALPVSSTEIHARASARCGRCTRTRG